MKEAQYKIDPRIVFRETFNSEESVRRNKIIPSSSNIISKGEIYVNQSPFNLPFIGDRIFKLNSFSIRIKIGSLKETREIATSIGLFSTYNITYAYGIELRITNRKYNFITKNYNINGTINHSAKDDLILVYENGNAKLYVNGIVDINTVCASPTSSLAFRIGDIYVGGLDYNGSIELIEIYKGALSAAEIATMYRNSNAKNIAFRDTDGYPYHYVKIGNQIWLKENLRTNKLPNGYTIPLIGSGGSNDTTWANLTTPGACWYSGSESTYRDYGMLYNWYAIEKINAAYARLGFRVPTQSDFTTLITHLGGTSVAGGKMKESGTTHWSSPNTGADNSSGFTGLGGGRRNTGNGIFELIGQYSIFWTSTLSSNQGICKYLAYNNSALTETPQAKTYGNKIRLIKI